MKCPFCQSINSKVVDKRSTENETAFRRRRECDNCNKRYSTYERIEGVILYVLKKDGNREAYNRDKLRNGIIRACEKRPVTMDDIKKIVSEIDSHLKNKGVSEVSSTLIGRLVMTRLKKLDKVSYIRFASVYKDFKDMEEFQDELEKLSNKNG
jgi:transcriptional repressor NrdR